MKRSWLCIARADLELVILTHFLHFPRLTVITASNSLRWVLRYALLSSHQAIEWGPPSQLLGYLPFIVWDLSSVRASSATFHRFLALSSCLHLRGWIWVFWAEWSARLFLWVILIGYLMQIRRRFSSLFSVDFGHLCICFAVIYVCCSLELNWFWPGLRWNL